MAERFPSDALESALKRWRDAGIISAQQADAIRTLEGATLDSLAGGRPAITPSMLITTIGGFLVLVASVVFVGLGWEDMGDVQRAFWATLAVAVPWIAAFFLRRTGQPLAVSFASALLALGTLALILLGYTIYRLAGWWPDDWRYNDPRADEYDERTQQLTMLSCTGAALAGAVFAFRLRIPWLLLLTGLLGWWVWQTGLEIWAPGDDPDDPSPWIISLYGIFLVAVGLVVSRIGLRKHAFWLFLVGLAQVFIFLGIDSIDDALGITGLAFLALSIVAIVLGLWIDYRVFLVFGALGLYGWVSALIVDTFGGSRAVAFGLILLGALIVAAGLAWQWWTQRRANPVAPGS